jgi:hypothetical protein
MTYERARAAALAAGTDPPDEPPRCESCWSLTTRLCGRCGQRICRRCATNHHVRNYTNPAELQDVGLCRAGRKQEE